MAHVGKVYPYHPQRDYSIIPNWTLIAARRYVIPQSFINFVNCSWAWPGLWISEEGIVDTDEGSIYWEWPGSMINEALVTYRWKLSLTFLQAPHRIQRWMEGPTNSINQDIGPASPSGLGGWNFPPGNIIIDGSTRISFGGLGGVEAQKWDQIP